MRARILWIGLLAAVLLSGCAEKQEARMSAPPVQTTVPVTAEPAAETTQVTEVPTELPTEPELPAQPVEEGFRYLSEGADRTALLTDSDYSTRITLQPGQTLRIESETAFAGLYIEWETQPGACSLSWEGGRIDQEAVFLHAYVRIPEAVSIAELTVEETGEICNIRLFTQGSTPDSVQAWLPPCEKADILVFPTHSDDDVLFFGPLIAYYAIEAGCTVQTAFLADHWYEPVRNHERLNGLWEMGVRHYPVLGTVRDYNAGSLEKSMQFHWQEDILGWQVEQLRRFRPLVAVGHDLNGEYGHSQHQLNAHYLTQAVEAAGDASQYPESLDRYGSWDTPKLYLHLYRENTLTLDVNTPLTKDPQGRTAFEIAQDAYLCHESQQQYYFQVLQGDVHPTADCRKFGLYRSLVGKDTGWDLMENVWRVRS